MEDITPDNIYNYDETNITDDPGNKTVKRGIVKGAMDIEWKENRTTLNLPV